jgi:Calcineurin-like phosphoesterase
MTLNKLNIFTVAMILTTARVTGLTADLAPRVAPEGNGGFTFGLIGDMPYGAEGDEKFPRLLADLNADRKLSFVVHDGDFKNGSSLCSDAVFMNRLDLFNQSVHPFIYVPGDNEWTDCHRANNGSYDPLERLMLLRNLFFATDETLGARTFTLERQSADPQFVQYRENVRWVVHDVLFVGLHVVGSNNNRGRTAAGDIEYSARNAANLVWLNQAFELAATRGYKAVMIVIQANPNFDLPATDARRSGFNDFLTALEAHTIAFGRTVVLVHGDSHYFRLDKPLVGSRSGRRIENFTRVETFGENDNHWLHASVAPGNPNVFVFDQRIVAANVVQQD